jgi:translocation and assembly module TamA
LKNPLRSLHTGLVLLLISSVVCAVAWSSATAGEATVAYQVDFSGLPDKTLRKTLESISATVALKGHPPATVSLLQRRADKDVPRLLQALKAQAYYGATVKVAIDETRKPVTVTFYVELGTAYPLKSVTIELPENEAHLKEQLPPLKALPLKLNEPAQARSIVAANKILVHRMKKIGFPFVKASEPKVMVDHLTHDVAVVFSIAAGPLAHFGPTTIDGLKSVEEQFVRDKLPWHKGQKFDADLLEKAQKRLIDTRLFAFARVTPGKSLDQEGLLPISIQVRERKPRTIRVGLSYYTDEGPGVNLSWENRNVFRRGEHLSLEIKASGIGLTGKASYQVPEFLRSDQSLVGIFQIADDDTDAYTSKNTEGAVIVERKFGERIRVGTGPSYRLARVTQFNNEDDFALLSLPTYFKWDGSNNLLNPTRGGRLNVQVNPYWDALDTEVSFLKGFASYSHYFRLLEQPQLVCAARATLGSLAGSSRDAIPADVRYYAGGGGSIRGYAYQTVGPLRDGDPIGGRSLLEVSAELRVKVTETLGFAVFLDGGNVFEAAYPDFSEALRWGTGAGLRYFTPFGPLRLDVGVPLDRRPGVDDPFQIYVSIGQAF